MRIGLFGGTFDPPHLGHIELAKEFYYASNVDLLIIMPSFIPPHKDKSKTSAGVRLEMARLAFLRLGELGINYYVSDYEISKKDTSYTINTVNFLIEKYNTSDISLCIGSDMLLSFEKWKASQELMEKCHIYSKARMSGEFSQLCSFAENLKNKYGAKIHIINESVFEVSSTSLRNAALKESEDADSLLISKEVLEYIKKNKIYENFLICTEEN